MKKIFTLFVMLAATLGMQAQDTWTVAGEKAITGASWDCTDVSNDMVSTDGVNFTLVKTGMMVPAKEAGYGYKVVKGHDWGELGANAYPNPDNAILEITEDAEYTITFTFNAETFEVAATAEKTGTYVKPEGDQTWTVAGVAELCGNAWSPEDTSNDMTTEDKVTYKWSKTNVALEKNTPYGFKIVADHSWDEAYPSDNYNIEVEENGYYTVEISFNAESHEIGVSTTKTGEYTPGEKTWTICGVEALCGSNWDPADVTNDMTQVAEGEFELVKTNIALLTDTEYEYKVAANHAWTESYGDGSSNQKFQLLSAEGFEDGNYDVTFSFLLETKTLDAMGELSTGINNLKVTFTKSAPIYNLQGQRVDAAFRGIGIQNGKKVVMK